MKLFRYRTRWNRRGWTESWFERKATVWSGTARLSNEKGTAITRYSVRSWRFLVIFAAACSDESGRSMANGLRKMLETKVVEV